MITKTNMFRLNESIVQKWKPVMEASGVSPITNRWKEIVTLRILENQEKFLREDPDSRALAMLTESAPLNATGSGISNYDPILISLVRRALPNLIAYDICGVQPMTGPTGLIFAMKSRYGDNTTARDSATEALFNEANTSISAGNQDSNATLSGTQTGNDAVSNILNDASFTVTKGMTTAAGEDLGDVGNLFAQMSFTIDKVTVTANTRAMRADYTLELAQDLKAIHGLDAETELANILSAEILTELNREVVRSIYISSSAGAQYGVTTNGTFDMDVDSNGRWMVEKFKGFIFQLEREANAIAKATRRGRGNVAIVSSDLASAMAMAGVLQYTPALSADLTVDDTGNTFAGMLHGRIKVFIDPYFGGSVSGDELCCIGYKGVSPYDAGIFYCPYVPLQMVRAVDPNFFQPKIAFKTRYGMVANPFATSNADGVVGTRNTAGQANIYYRLFRVRNLM